jgi:hypothetical protein
LASTLQVGAVEVQSNGRAIWRYCSPKRSNRSPERPHGIGTVLMRAATCAEEDRGANCHRLVRFSAEVIDRQQITKAIAPEFAERLRNVMQAFCDKLAIKSANELFGRIVALSEEVPLTPEFAKEGGIGLRAAGQQLTAAIR